MAVAISKFCFRRLIRPSVLFVDDSFEGDSAGCEATKYTGQHKQNKNAHIRVSKGIRIHDCSFWSGEDV